MLETPVLFLIFNRPENTSQVFEGIRKARPKRLFVAADGPREHKKGEIEICRQARLIATSVDWECEVKTLFRKKNLGCKVAVSSGISWFFEQVEFGIILEDDCKPDSSFFTFCEKMLSHYHNDSRVMMICGTNYLSYEISSKIEDSYFFANYYPIWGWATWKRAWSLYDVEMKNWNRFKNTKQLYWLFSNPEISKYYESMFDLIENGFDTWDIQWWFTCIFQSGLSIIPKYNLISNIGVIGTHSSTQGDYRINMPVYPLDEGEIKHPLFVVTDKYLNEMTYKMSHAQIDIDNGAIRDDFSNNNTYQYHPKKNIKNFIKKIVRKK